MASGSPSSGFISRKLREEIFTRDGWRCFYCGNPLTPQEGNTPLDSEAMCRFASIDHLTPLSRGGTRETSNLVAACLRCNNQKRTMTLEEYRQFVKCNRPAGRAIEFLRKALDEIQTDFDAGVYELISWHESSLPTITFYGEREQ